jgi:hypothetical protein
MRWTRRHALGLSRTVAALLFCYGILLVLDQLSWLTRALQTGPTASG